MHKNNHSRLFRTFLLGVLLVTLVVSISGCNLPHDLPTSQPKTDQRKTEIAGILNPEGIESQPTPTFASAMPTSVLPEQQTAQLEGYIPYTTQWGDTLPALAQRFGVETNQILSSTPLPTEALLPIGVAVQIPDILDTVLPYTDPILPDSEVIYSPSVGDFDAAAYAVAAGGFLATYAETVKSEVLSGPEIIRRVAVETSTNPRLLLAFLEYRSGWVNGIPPGAAKDPYPIGFGAGTDTGLYRELMITAKLLAQGYYGWREGTFLDLTFYNGGYGRLSPTLNAGSVALMHLFASLYDQTAFEANLLSESSFLKTYQQMFGDYWVRAAEIDPDIYTIREAPTLTLPFLPGEAWSLTGGPHITWQTGTPRGAVDFAPITGESPCAVSFRWTTAAAPGLVVRSENSVVAIDLDGDGDESTGWVLIYQHMAEDDRAPVGTWLDQDSPVGHPSCEGGQATGTHLHFTRKFNGEWVGVGGPFPLVLSGWQAFAGEGRYEGTLQKGDLIVTNRPDGSSGSTIIRDN